MQGSPWSSGDLMDFSMDLNSVPVNLEAAGPGARPSTRPRSWGRGTSLARAHPAPLPAGALPSDDLADAWLSDLGLPRPGSPGLDLALPTNNVVEPEAMRCARAARAGVCGCAAGPWAACGDGMELTRPEALGAHAGACVRRSGAQPPQQLGRHKRQQHSCPVPGARQRPPHTPERSLPPPLRCLAPERSSVPVSAIGGAMIPAAAAATSSGAAGSAPAGVLAPTVISRATAARRTISRATTARPILVAPPAAAPPSAPCSSAAAPPAAAAAPSALTATGGGATTAADDSDAGQFFSDSDSEPDAGARGGGGGGARKGKGKRRRRVRNAKQQELNRLAQQRYRERKKAKFSVLQGTVEELSEQLERLAALESGAAAMAARGAALEALAAEQARRLGESGGALARQQEQLRIAADTISEQQRALREREARVEELEGRLSGLQRHAAAAVAAAGAMGEAGGGGAGGGAAAAGAAGAGSANGEALAAAVREILGGLVLQAGAAAAAAPRPERLPMPDAVLQQIRRCCAEVALQLSSLRAVQAEAPRAIQVPCC
ncbi:MAG: hypothetical protein J3K34DRAFT_288805 [Monoraphidium minutum]|nr:MAG: hypothetical protein J3K34DRAFT_288805 [Monoraphidium minutum]